MVGLPMSEPTPDVATDAALRLIASHRRRRILQYLRENWEGGVPLETLAGEIAGSDTTESPDSRTGVERAKIELHHNHLPKLAEHDVIEWDQEKGVVTRGPAFDAVEPLVALLQRHSTALPTRYLSAET